jgi:hypothetical protein
MEDAHGPPATEGRVGVLPLVCEAAQRLTLLVARPLLLVQLLGRLAGFPGGAINRVGDHLGPRHEDRVAGGHLGDARVDALGHVDKHGLIERLVFGGNHGPAGLRAPGGVGQRAEAVCSPQKVISFVDSFF